MSKNKSIADLMLREHCTGCGVCKAVCKYDAIEFKTDGLGFRYPVINNKCSNCGQCANYCPSLQPKSIEPQEDCYLAWSKDEQIHFTSSSGGLSMEISKWMIDNGGFVVGCVWDDYFNAVLKIIEDKNALTQIQGSKYVQSYIDEKLWSELKNKINSGQKGVIFGMPCQIAAIKKYTKGCPSLFFVELLCHGGNSPRALQEHLGLLKNSNRGCVIDKVQFRGGKYDCSLTLWSEDKLIYREGQYTDKYFWTFMRHSMLQEACYQCKYATRERVADITLADFWGISSQFIADKNKMNGYNLIIVHSDKGYRLFDVVKNKLEYWSRNIEEAIAGNDTLHQPTRKPQSRHLVVMAMKVIGFEKSVWADVEWLKQWFRRYGTPKIKLIIKKVVSFIMI